MCFKFMSILRANVVGACNARPQTRKDRQKNVGVAALGDPEERKKKFMKTKIKNNKGITLIALIITIIIMLILVAITINVVINSGLITSAKNAGKKTRTAYEEEAQVENKIKVGDENVIDYLNKLNQEEEEKEYIPTTTSYVGKYAYVNGTYGIIFADLAIPVENGVAFPAQTYEAQKGKYSYPGEEDEVGENIDKDTFFKKYYIKPATELDEVPKDIFGTDATVDITEVIALDTDSTGHYRFYVMALKDLDTSKHYWYQKASGKMDDYASTTSTGFGEGKQNTDNMKKKWNKEPTEGYGAGVTIGSIPDMWGLTFPSGWFVPSKDEWAAFVGELGITKSNYSSKRA